MHVGLFTLLMATDSLVLLNCYKFTSRCLHGARIWCTFAFVCTVVIVLFLRVYSITTITASYSTLIIRRDIATNKNLVVSRTYVKNRPLEAVDISIEYKRNIYFTVKTTASNYQDRLSTLILTWFQTVHKDDIAIISDDVTTGGPDINNLIREAGFHLITTTCPHTHMRKALCCKSGEEFHSYYKAVENTPSYQWFCHVDDDVYVNVPRLSHLLQKYDPGQPYYIGRWVHEDPSVNLTKRRYSHFESKNFRLKSADFQYATGAAYCISHALMTKARKYFDGKEAFCHNTDLFSYGDDMTVGSIIHVLLGYHLTSIKYFSNQYERISSTTSVSSLKKYITVSYKKNKRQQFVHVVPIRNMFSDDQTRFMSFHCLLYPNVSWCRKQ